MRIQSNKASAVEVLISERRRFSAGGRIFIDYDMQINDMKFYVRHRVDAAGRVTVEGAQNVEEYLKELGADEALECVRLYWRLQNELLLASSDIDLYEV